MTRKTRDGAILAVLGLAAALGGCRSRAPREVPPPEPGTAGSSIDRDDDDRVGDAPGTNQGDGRFNSPMAPSGE